ncbi:MAG: DUF1697 domain-containing protein [Bacteroidales bacterium]|nr:DUF1697 domain-containing protein [Bacteroidales bacterium]
MGAIVNTYIVLLRGVMPVGKNKLSMAQLREVLSDAGFSNVRTYIQSGNALVDSIHTAREVEKTVHELIKRHLGPGLTIVVRNTGELQEILDENPFGEGYNISRVFFVMFENMPSKEKVKELLKNDFGDEKVVVSSKAAYMYIPGNAARSKLSNNWLEKKLGVSSTSRNFNTMNKLIEMSKTKF